MGCEYLPGHTTSVSGTLPVPAFLCQRQKDPLGSGIQDHCGQFSKNCLKINKKIKKKAGAQYLSILLAWVRAT